VGASERHEWLRAASRLVFAAEIGANMSLCVLAYFLRGRMVHAKVSCSCEKNTTLLASMAIDEMKSFIAVEGTTTSAVFEAYVEQVLVPILRLGQA
jgi:hypothetical protein